MSDVAQQKRLLDLVDRIDDLAEPLDNDGGVFEPAPDPAWLEHVDSDDLGTKREKASTSSSLPTLSAEELFAPLPPIPWTCEGIRIAPGRPTLFAGYGFAGKSIASQSLALSVAAGRPVWGVFSCRRGRVVHLDYEQGRRLTAERYQRLARGMGIGIEQLRGQLRVAVYPQLFIGDPAAEEILARETEGHALAIIDSLTCAVPSIEENSRDIAQPLYALGRVSERTGVTFLLLHHARKPQKDAPGGAAMTIRGSSAIFGAVDSAFVFSSTKGEPISVEHVRSPVTGVTLEAFGLAVEDLEIDGNPRAALRVRHVDDHQISSGPSRFDDLKETIIGVIRDNPGLSSANAIAVRVVGGNKTSKLEALRELVAEGRIAQPGGERSAYRAR